MIEQYKVHQLDWFDVESRMKIICGEMLMPIAKMAKAAKTGLERETTKLLKCIEDTEKLNNAVFYRARRTKNIFHIMQDEITDIKALEV